MSADQTVPLGHELLIPFTWNFHCSYVLSSLGVGLELENNERPNDITNCGDGAETKICCCSPLGLTYSCICLGVTIPDGIDGPSSNFLSS